MLTQSWARGHAADPAASASAHSSTSSQTPARVLSRYPAGQLARSALPEAAEQRVAHGAGMRLFKFHLRHVRARIQTKLKPVPLT